MPWIRLDDGFAEHPKLERAGMAGGWLHVAALCYCARNLTDGHIPRSKALRLADVPKPAQVVARLVEVGLWDIDGDDYVIHDYLELNPSRAQVMAERKGAAERQRRSRGKSRRDIPSDSGRSAPDSHGESSTTPVPYPPVKVSSSVSSSVGPPGGDDDDRIRAAAVVLGRRDHERAVADGVRIHHRDRHLAGCIERWLTADRPLVALAGEHPTWDATRLVDTLDPPAGTIARPDPPAAACGRCGGRGVIECDTGAVVCDHGPEPHLEAVPA